MLSLFQASCHYSDLDDDPFTFNHKLLTYLSENVLCVHTFSVVTRLVVCGMKHDSFHRHLLAQQPTMFHYQTRCPGHRLHGCSQPPGPLYSNRGHKRTRHFHRASPLKPKAAGYSSQRMAPNVFSQSSAYLSHNAILSIHQHIH